MPLLYCTLRPPRLTYPHIQEKEKTHTHTHTPTYIYISILIYITHNLIKYH